MDEYPDFAADRDAAIRWARQMLERDFVVLDTETTGLDDDDEAVAIGLVAKDGTILLDTLLCHEKRCTFVAEMTHGIIWEMTRGAPHFREIAPRLLDLINGRDLLAYNVIFDMRIIGQMIARYEIVTQKPYPAGQIFHDVMGYFAQFYGQWSEYHGSYTWKKLTIAAAFLGVDNNNAHSAAADALMTLRVVEAMAKRKLSGEE